MAKRAPTTEAPYSPLDADLARSVMEGVTPGGKIETTGAEAISTGRSRRQKSPQREIENEKLLELPTARNPAAVAGTKGHKRLSREKRVLVTSDEERQIERLVDRIGEDLGTSLKLSHLLRACMTLMCHAEGELHGTAATVGPLIRPANGDVVALAQFEFDLAKLLSKALRDAPPLR
jgi:hypothetical protein